MGEQSEENAFLKRFLWYDPKVNNSENVLYRDLFQEQGFLVQPFIEVEDAAQFLQQRAVEEKWLCLSCGSSGEQFVSRVEHLEQVGGVLVFTSAADVPKHMAWAGRHSKVRKVTAWVNNLFELTDEIALNIAIARVPRARDKTRLEAQWRELAPEVKEACEAPAVDPTDDRFQCAVLPYGTAVQRSESYFMYCTASNTSNLLPEHVKVIRHCRKDLEEEGCKQSCLTTTALLRAYTEDLHPVKYPDMKRALYQDVNAALRDDEDAGLSKHGAFVRAVRCAMKRRCKAGDNFNTGVVYRQMSLGPDVRAMYVPGFKFLWPGFVSTGKSLAGTAGFKGNALFVIEVSKQVGVTYAIDVSDISCFKDEEEVVFYPYSGFEVIACDKDVAEPDMFTITLRPYDTLLIDREHGETNPGDIPFDEL